MVITLLAKKGGVGKSTVCLLLHEAFKKAGKSVAIQDWDAQGTSTKALSLINGQSVKPNAEYDSFGRETVCPEGGSSVPRGITYRSETPAAEASFTTGGLPSPTTNCPWPTSTVVAA
jgi:cellulose biosynthesis protein BcsQ